jgi:hypothetical protein
VSVVIDRGESDTGVGTLHSLYPLFMRHKLSPASFLIGSLIISSLALQATQNGRMRSNRIHWTPGGVDSTVTCALTLTGRTRDSRFFQMKRQTFHRWRVVKQILWNRLF